MLKTHHLDRHSPIECLAEKERVLQKKRSSSSIVSRTFSMIHNKNNHTVGETKSTNSASATARVCLRKLPQYMRLQVFHSLTDLDYFFLYV
jgi:hypothetical protein